MNLESEDHLLGSMLRYGYFGKGLLVKTMISCFLAGCQDSGHWGGRGEAVFFMGGVKASVLHLDDARIDCHLPY